MTNIQHFFDPRTWTLTYVAWDPATRDAVIIDSVLDFDPVNLRFFEESMDKLLAFVSENELAVHGVLETHVHADHITAAHRLRKKLDAKVVASSAVPAIQATFTDLLELNDQPTDGTGFDVLLDHGEVWRAGSLAIRAIHTPGHTPACVTYQIDDAVFTGDSMFMPDFGTGRCDFPKGSAEDLYDSVMERLYTLPDETRVFVGHDYQPGGRPLSFQTTIGESKKANIQLQADTPREQFVQWRAERDATLNLPSLIFNSVQINVNAGRLPTPSERGGRFMKIPVLQA